MMTLSIIIPVYKVEAYLDSCLKSVCGQDISDCEILLINDCSPDRCGEICEAWSRKDKRIRVFHHADNRGLSAARNTGLDMATGKYVTFVDSDDYIAPETLSHNLKRLQEHPEIDVLEYPVRVHHGAETSYCYRPGSGHIESFTQWVKRKGYVHSYAWNKIYLRSLWRDRRFPVGKYFEDGYTVPYVLRDAGAILTSDCGMYYYCCHDGSISNTVSLRHESDLLQATFKLFNNLVADPGLTETDKDEAYLHLCNQQIVYLQMGGTLVIPDRKIPFRRALFTRRPCHTYIKAVMMAVFGRNYCEIIAGTRKLVRK